ncbi:MAG TPA: hypothetical protein VIK86_02100 [Candidatus Paceibacterota bacterium]
MTNIKSFEDVSNLPEVVELKKILIGKGYKLESFNNSPEDECISLRLVKNTIIVEVEVYDKIQMWVFSSGRNKEELKETQTDLNDSCEVISYIGNKYGYTLSEDGGSFYKEFEKEENNHSKTFLIIDEDKVDLEEKVQEFIISKFGEDMLDKTFINIEYSEEDLGTPDYKEYITIQLFFNEYKYANKVYGEQIESVGLILENKGLQPFYIDGKFITLTVYEYNTGLLIQKADIVYGFKKYEISNDFAEFILTC